MKPFIAHRAPSLALAVAAAASTLMFWGQFAAPVSAAASGETNIQNLGDDRLMGELAGRGLESLLNREFEVKQVPESQRGGIKTLRALHELTDPASKLSPVERQRRARIAGAGMAVALPQLNDLQDLMKYAGALLDAEVVPDADLLQFWGDNPQLQAQLKPCADAVVDLLNKASKLAAEKRDKLSAGLGNNIAQGAIAKQIDDLDNPASGAAYNASLNAYYRALAIDGTSEKGKDERQKIADAAMKGLVPLDSNDSTVQPIIRQAIAHLEAIKGEYKDSNTVYNSLITGDKTPLPDSATGGANPDTSDEKKIAPAPTIDQQFNARYFSIVGLLNLKDIAGATKAQAELNTWKEGAAQKSALSSYGAAMDLLQYRILNAQAALASSADEKKKYIDLGNESLTKLKKEHPEFTAIINQQLVSRLDPNTPIPSLDPLQLQAVMNFGLTEARKPDAEKLDTKLIERSIAAAREVVSRKDRTGFEPKLVDDARLLVPNMLSRLSRDPGVLPAQQIKYAVEAANSYLDYAQSAYTTNTSRATESFEVAGHIAFDLNKTADGKPGVTELYDRFLPIAVGAPFNRKPLAYQYGKRLRHIDKPREAAAQFRQVPKSDPNYFKSQYYLMLSLKDALNTKLDAAERAKLVDEIGTVGDTVKQLAAGSHDPALQAMGAQSSLIGAEIAVSETKKKDPKRALSLLSDFETQVKGLPADRQKPLLTEALFARVNAYMALGQFNEATTTLKSLLGKTEPGEAIGLVRELLDQLDTAYVSADLNNDTDRMREIAKNEAQLTGSLASWAKDHTDPKIRKFAYSYAVYDAKTRRIAGTLDEDPQARTKDLTAALALYQGLQSPENTKAYLATLDPKQVAAGQTSPTDLQVDVGIAFTNFELGNWDKAEEELGALIGARRLGGATVLVDDHGEPKVKNNDVYWEATYKFLKSNIEIAKARKDAGIMESEKKYLKQILIRGGIPERWQDEFESARKDIIPEFQVPVPSTQPVPARQSAAAAPATPPHAPN